MKRKRAKLMVASSTQAEVGAKVNIVELANTVVEANTVAEASIVEEATIKEQASIVAEVIIKEQASIVEEVSIAEEVREAATEDVVDSAQAPKRKTKRHSELSPPKTSNSTTKPLAIKSL